MKMMIFAKTIGHQKQKDMFFRAFQKEQLSHAYVLVGPEGIGKTSFAADFAIALGAHPVLDVFIFDELGGLPVSEARSLQDQLSLTPTNTVKVAIITQAEEMTQASANSLLKTLEEPPNRSLLFLITSKYHSLLPTIASRVQKVDFSILSAKLIEETLSLWGASKAQIPEIVDFAAGRLGIAKRLLESENLLQAYQDSIRLFEILEKGTIVEKLQASEALGTKDPNEILEFLKLAMRFWVNKGIGIIQAEKLHQAWIGLGRNLNTRLVLDNLFVP